MFHCSEPLEEYFLEENSVTTPNVMGQCRLAKPSRRFPRPSTKRNAEATAKQVRKNKTKIKKRRLIGLSC